MTEERQFLREEGFGLDLSTVVHTNHLERLLEKYKEKQLLINGVVKSLPTEEEIGLEIKKKLIEINKDKPVPSIKHDLGYSNGYLECYDFITK